MSLLQGVLRSTTEDIDVRLRSVRLNSKGGTPAEDKADSSDDDLVNVVRCLSWIPSRAHISLSSPGLFARHTCQNAPVLARSRWRRRSLTAHTQKPAAYLLQPARPPQGLPHRTLPEDILQTVRQRLGEMRPGQQEVGAQPDNELWLVHRTITINPTISRR